MIALRPPSFRPHFYNEFFFPKPEAFERNLVGLWVINISLVLSTGLGGDSVEDGLTVGRRRSQ